MELSTPCIKSAYRVKRDGYASCTDPFNPGKVAPHHRLVYMLANNLTPKDIKGLVVRHKCDNKVCINPEHLELGTQKDNMDDMNSRGRRGVCNTRLTEELVRAIRQESKLAFTTELAVKYGVHPTTIGLVRSGKTWKHVV